uniref:Uncharacterized protein n=1 Tax=Romanomermis culicivorax TaxID=13658 RepID=A0A915KL48_ROMCU
MAVVRKKATCQFQQEGIHAYIYDSFGELTSFVQFGGKIRFYCVCPSGKPVLGFSTPGPDARVLRALSDNDENNIYWTDDLTVNAYFRLGDYKCRCQEQLKEEHGFTFRVLYRTLFGSCVSYVSCVKARFKGRSKYSFERIGCRLIGNFNIHLAMYYKLKLLQYILGEQIACLRDLSEESIHNTLNCRMKDGSSSIHIQNLLEKFKCCKSALYRPNDEKWARGKWRAKKKFHGNVKESSVLNLLAAKSNCDAILD